MGNVAGVAPDAENKSVPRIGTGWLIVGVVVLAVATAILIVYAAYTNQRDHTEPSAVARAIF